MFDLPVTVVVVQWIFDVGDVVTRGFDAIAEVDVTCIYKLFMGMTVVMIAIFDLSPLTKQYQNKNYKSRLRG